MVQVRILVAVRNREMKTALFLALNGLDGVGIVATATTSGELASFSRTLRPDVVIVEDGLPGSSLAETIGEVAESLPGSRVLMIDTGLETLAGAPLTDIEAFDDIDKLLTAVAGAGAE